MPPLDPTLFPLREGSNVPRELIAPFAARLARQYGGPLDAIALRGGISLYELLLLQPAPEGKTQVEHEHAVCDLTLRDAKQQVQQLRAAHQAKKEADAEAAMLAMMEAEEASMTAEPAA